MILDTTYKSKENKDLINDLIGRPFSFIESIRMGGIGSKRMIIENVSPNLKPYVNTVADANYANIELRPIGILIHINKGLKNFTWVIPYFQLVIYKTSGSSIHAQGRFIHFKNSITFRENKLFFNKIWIKKLDFDEEFNFQYT